MRFRILILSLVIILSFQLLNSCTTQKQSYNSEQYHLAINYQNFPESVNLSEMIQSFQIVPIETNDESVIGRIAQIDKLDDLIFIRVSDESHGLFVYNNKGNFLYQIGHFGQGPGEHTQLVSFSFNWDHTRIYLTTAAQQKIIEFTISGEWIQDIKIDHPINDLAFLSDSIYVSGNMTDYYVRIGNLKSGNYVDTLKKYAGSFQYGGQIFSPSINNGVLFGSTRLDTFFHINQNEISARFIFDFRPNNVTKKELRNGRFRFPFPPNLIWTEGPYFESEKWFYSSCYCENKSGERKGKYSRNYFLFNKESGLLNHLAKDDILFFASHSFTSLTQTGEFASYIDPVYLLERKEQILANKQYSYPSGFFEQLEEIKEGDNPILLFCKLK